MKLSSDEGLQHPHIGNGKLPLLLRMFILPWKEGLEIERPLIACSLNTGDQGLISAFVERWHKETSHFHLPVREVTITLDDVAFLLHLPITGAFHRFETLHVDEAVLLLEELLEVNADEARVETIQCHGAYVQLSWL